MTNIDTADHVFHRPTGETWLVAYVEGDRLCACGWPCTLARLEDCALVKKATAEERDDLLRLTQERAAVLDALAGRLREAA